MTRRYVIFYNETTSDYIQCPQGSNCYLNVQFGIWTIFNFEPSYSGTYRCDLPESLNDLCSVTFELKAAGMFIHF